MPEEISDITNAARDESFTMFFDFNSMYQMAQFPQQSCDSSSKAKTVSSNILTLV